MSPFLKRGLLIVVLMTLTDAAYAVWMLTTAAKLAWQAGVSAVILIVLSGFVTRAYVDDKRMLGFAAVGAFLGSYLPVVILR